MRRFLLLVALLTPATVLAVSLTSQTSVYSDGPFTTQENAGISVLTETKAVQGYPDGSFRPKNLLNRAEFLKIILLTRPDVVQLGAGEACFKDIQGTEWFAPYVCAAKKAGIIGGYPDGTFRPATNVNYAEALKILGSIYNLINNDQAAGEWFLPYKKGAYDAGVGLSGLENDMQHPLTRGEMARLAAAYLLHADGRLAEYRAMESGQNISRSSSSSSIATSSSSSSIAAPVNVIDVLPVGDPKTSFAVLGHLSPVVDVCDSTYDPAKLWSDVESGRDILNLKFFDSVTHTLLGGTTNEKDGQWYGKIPTSPFYIRWDMRKYSGADLASTYDSTQHRTAVKNGGCRKQGGVTIFAVPAAIVDIASPDPVTAPLIAGNQQKIGSYAFIGQKATSDQLLQIKTVKILTRISSKTKLSAITAVRRDKPENKVECLYNEPPYFSCDIPDYLSDIGESTIFDFYADVVATPGAGSVQLEMSDFGGPFTQGSVSWKNQFEAFTWMSPTQTVIKSTLYQ